MPLGAHLQSLRERDRLSRADAALQAQISGEHLRNIESDKTRPSPEVLIRLLGVYDLDKEDEIAAWVFLGTAHLPAQVRKHVEVHPRGITHKETP